MAYDEELADRIRTALAGEPGWSERAMFGGLAFLVDGHMALAAIEEGGVMVRVDPAETDSLVDDTVVSRMEMGGRRMNGWLRVTADAVTTDASLAEWVRRGVGYVRTLPPKG
jgi:TfoX/Sxy family transcriptional regulator of competence genes